MAKTETTNMDHAEVTKAIEQGLAHGKEEGFILEEVLASYPGTPRPQAKMLLDRAIPGRTPENPVRFAMDPTPNRRCSPHLDRMPAIQQEDAALRQGGRPPRVQEPGPAPEGTEHVVFTKGRRQILRVKAKCRGNGHKFACITHGMIFGSAEELARHCEDSAAHDTSTTEFDAPRLGEGHVTSLWCEHSSRETKQNVMGVLEPIWVQHGIEALPRKV